MKNAKKKKKTAHKKSIKAPEYPHRDASGMSWRMVGMRPVSALADQVMRNCGLSPNA